MYDQVQVYNLQGFNSLFNADSVNKVTVVTGMSRIEESKCIFTIFKPKKRKKTDRKLEKVSVSNASQHEGVRHYAVRKSFWAVFGQLYCAYGRPQNFFKGWANS